MPEKPSTQFLLNPTGSGGDVYPYLPIGKELQRRGHQVRVLSSPLYRKLFELHGLRFADIGRKRDMQRVSQFVDLQDRRNAWRAAIRWGAVSTMRQTYEKIMRCVDQSDNTVIVSSPLGFGARIAAEKHSIPMATLALSPFVLRTLRNSPRIDPLWLGRWVPSPLKRLQYLMADRFAIDPLIARQTNRFRKDLGLPPISRFMHRWNLSPDRIIGLFPLILCESTTDFPQQTELVGPVLWTPVARMNNAENGVAKYVFQAKEFARQGDPPLLILSGSVGIRNRDEVQRLIRICRDAGLRSILVESNHLNVPDSLPAGVSHFAYLPIARILPDCVAILHSGGIGTVCQALAAGVPQLIFPGVNDQMDNACRVHRKRAGLLLKSDAASEHEIRAMLLKITRDQQLRSRSRVLASQMSAVDSVARCCDLLEKLLPAGLC